MRSNTAEKPMSRVNPVAYRNEAAPAPRQQPLMTPARRLALEALEREFHDLLQKHTLNEQAA